jgi:glycosyltransferase involved in cell wall biosynthesis
LVSVVIPTYNYGRFIIQAVESVLAQTHPRIEVIVVDDGSTDDTRVRLAPYGDRIRYIYQENEGLSAARNCGIRHATGEWIAFLDSDDTWHPRKIELQMRASTRNPDARLIATASRMEFTEVWPDINGANSVPLVDITLSDLIIRSRFSPSSVLLHRNCLDSSDPFDVELRSVEDRDLWLRIATRFRIIKIDLALVYSRIHGGNMSSAASRMEQYEHLVLTRAFANISSLRSRLLLRRKSFSYASFSCAWMHREAGMPGVALLRLIRSFLLWPFPYRRVDTRTTFARPKFVLVTLAGLLRRTPLASQKSLCASW